MQFLSCIKIFNKILVTVPVYNSFQSLFIEHCIPITVVFKLSRKQKVFEVGPTLYNCYTNVLCLLGLYVTAYVTTTIVTCTFSLHSVALGGVFKCFISA